MTEYRPKARCPKCDRAPNVSFSGTQVAQAKRERQATRVMMVKCQRCGDKYWIRAREIAESVSLTNGSDPMKKLHALTRAALVKQNIRTLDDLKRVPDWGEVPGIGPSRVKEIEKVLDVAGSVA